MTTTTPREWHAQAACTNSAPALFDPPTSDEPPRALRSRISQALNVCRGCTVTAACLADALTHHDEGIRGAQMLCNKKGSYPRRTTAPATAATAANPTGTQL